MKLDDKVEALRTFYNEEAPGTSENVWMPAVVVYVDDELVSVDFEDGMRLMYNLEANKVRPAP